MRRDQAGASAIEFALVLPVLLMLVFAIVEFSMVMYDKVVITHAAREAVRAGAVLRNPKLTADEIARVAQQYCGTRLMTMGPAQSARVQVHQTPDPVFNSPLEVIVEFTYHSLMAESLLHAWGLPIVLSSRASALNE